MIRGTTAQFRFKFPNELDIKEISYIDVIAWQKGYKGTTAAPLPIRKTFTNQNWDSVLLEDEHTLVVVLSAENTARFTDKLKGYIQCKVVITGEAVYGTYQQRFTVYPMHDAITGGDNDDPNIETDDGWIILDGETVAGDDDE